VLTVTYGGGDLVLGQPVEELLLVVGSVLHVGRSDGQLNKIGEKVRTK